MKKTHVLATALLMICLLASPASAAPVFYEQQEPLDPETALQWLEEYAPKIADDLEIIQRIDPDIYMEVLEEATMEIPEGEELRQADPELFELFIVADEKEVRSIRLAVQLAVEKDASKKARMKKEIRSLVEEVFDLRLEQHQIIVQEIERELAQLKKDGKVRKQNRGKVIDKRYEELIDPDSRALEWW